MEVFRWILANFVAQLGLERTENRRARSDRPAKIVARSMLRVMRVAFTKITSEKPLWFSSWRGTDCVEPLAV